VSRISRLPFDVRKKSAKDLGETLVVAHAAVKAVGGEDVIVIIDDAEGAKLAWAEKTRLDRLRAQGTPVGSIVMVYTVGILRKAAGGKHLPDKAAMREVYERLRKCDDGLLPINRTGLLQPAL